MRNFSKFRDEIISKQENFYSTYEENLKKEFPDDLREVETETLEEELQFPIIIFDDPLESEEQLEIKTELEDCVNDEVIFQNTLHELSQLGTTKANNLCVN